jgi:GT2 family glycosyltransferase
LIYRSFSANHEFVPLIQNSGIGINAHFEGYDLQSYEPVTAPQNHHDFVGVCGVSKLVRADVFHELGGFDPRYFMYYEDLDFSLRLRKRGYKSELVVDAVLKHHHGGSSNVRSKFFARQVAWSLLYFQWQHASRFQKWKLLLATVMRARTEEDEGMYRSQQINRFALSKFKCLFDERSFSMHWLLRWAGGSIL